MTNRWKSSNAKTDKYINGFAALCNRDKNSRSDLRYGVRMRWRTTIVYAYRQGT